MITLEILDYNHKFVQRWSFEDNMPIPNKGDTLLIHFGENNENEYRVNVLHREFDETKPNVVCIITDYARLKKQTEDL